MRSRFPARGAARLSCIALLILSFFALKSGSARQSAAFVSHSARVSPLNAALPVSEAPGQAVPAERQIIKVDVALVTVPVMVADRNGRYIYGLKESDFHIYENGVEQRIDRLIPEAESFDVALMMDSSGSTHFKFGDIQSAALAFVDALRPQDRLMIVSFDSQVAVNSELTVDRARLRGAILGTHGTSASTRLYDALDYVLRERFDRLSGRKAIVLFTDGMDNGSERIDSGGTLAEAEHSDVIVYAIQYDTRKDGMPKPPDWAVIPRPQGYPTLDDLYAFAVKYLRDLTGHSGGQLYHAETISSLNDAFSQIAEELRRQYTLCYYPVNQKRDGPYRRIRVTVDRPGAKVRARAGYRAGSQPSSGK
jgi:Ca-activated chloride channel family protein